MSSDSIKVGSERPAGAGHWNFAAIDWQGSANATSVTPPGTAIQTGIHDKVIKSRVVRVGEIRSTTCASVVTGPTPGAPDNLIKRKKHWTGKSPL